MGLQRVGHDLATQQTNKTDDLQIFFTLLNVSFAVQKRFFSFIYSHLSIFAYVPCAFGVISKKSLQR